MHFYLGKASRRASGQHAPSLYTAAASGRLIASDLAGLLYIAAPAPYSLWVGSPSLDTASSGLPLLLATGVPLSSASVSRPWRNSCGTVIICSACTRHVLHYSPVPEKSPVGKSRAPRVVNLQMLFSHKQECLLTSAYNAMR